MWPYDDQEADWLTSRSSEEIIADARRIRAEAAASLIRLAVARIGALLRRAFATVAAWRERQRITIELQAMSDRDLADIGLCRGDIAAVAEGSYRDERSTRARPRPFLVRRNPGYGKPAPADAGHLAA